MARAGNTIENPYAGERVLFTKTASDTGGRMLHYTISIQSRGGGRVEHAHPLQSKRVKVLAGEARLSIDGMIYAVRAGDCVEIPAGTRHAIRNEGREEVRMAVELEPALRTELVLETIYGLARDGRSNRNGMPGILQMAVLTEEFHDEIGGLPGWFMKLRRVLAPVAEILGYRPWYLKYSHPITTYPGAFPPASPLTDMAGW